MQCSEPRLYKGVGGIEVSFLATAAAAAAAATASGSGYWNMTNITKGAAFRVFCRYVCAVFGSCTFVRLNSCVNTSMLIG